jgi:tetratricopeptide (TPR) repeat protein
MIRTMLLVLILAVSVNARESEEPWLAEHQAGDAAMVAGEYAKALAHFQKAHAIVVEAKGDASFEATRELWFIADCHQFLGNFNEAEKLARRVLPVYRERFGSAHPIVGDVLRLIGAACRDTGRPREARRAYLRAYEIWTRAKGPEDPGTLDTLSQVAHLEYLLGRYEPSLARIQIVLAAYGKQESTDPNRITSALSLRGVCLARLDRREEALPDYRRVLELRIEQLGKDHSFVGSAENNLGGILRDLSRFDESETHYLRSIGIFRALPGGQIPDVAYPLNGLADVRRKQGRLDEAERLCREALAVREERLVSGDVTIASSLVSLAEILHDAARNEEAEEICERAFAILSVAVDTSYDGFNRLIECWLAILMAEEKTAAIAEVGRRVKALEEAEWEQVRGAAGLAEVQKHLEKAELEWLRAIEVAGNNVRRLRTGHAGIGRTLIAAGKHREAVAHLEIAAALFRKAPDEDEFPRVRNLLRLIDVLNALGRRDETPPLLSEALPFLEKAHAAKAAWALEGYVAALVEDGNLEEALPLARRLPEKSPVRRRALFLAGEYEEAERGYRLAIEKDRSSGAPWLGLARIRRAQGRLDEAEIYARKSIALDGESPASLELLASIVEGLGRKKEAAALRARK